MTKTKQTRSSILTLCALGGMSPMVAQAGEPMMPPPTPMIESSPESAVSGVLSFDYNTHFISYGFDVWGGGNDFNATNATFNPSLELNWAIGDFTAILGTWWDVNNNLSSSLGGDIQEIDVYAGGSYAIGDFSLSAIYQAWIYGSDTEHVIDFGIGYDTFLSPSLTIHHRFDEGASGGNTGTILVAGVEYGFDLGPVSFGVPLNVAYFLDDDFHPTSTDDGIGYGSLGLSASVPLAFIPETYGAWDIHAGVTYYVTSSDVIGNADDDFLTGNIGISCAF